MIELSGLRRSCTSVCVSSSRRLSARRASVTSRNTTSWPIEGPAATACLRHVTSAAPSCVSPSVGAARRANSASGRPAWRADSPSQAALSPSWPSRRRAGSLTTRILPSWPISRIPSRLESITAPRRSDSSASPRYSSASSSARATVSASAPASLTSSSSKAFFTSLSTFITPRIRSPRRSGTAISLWISGDADDVVRVERHVGHELRLAGLVGAADDAVGHRLVGDAGQLLRRSADPPMAPLRHRQGDARPARAAGDQLDRGGQHGARIGAARGGAEHVVEEPLPAGHPAHDVEHLGVAQRQGDLLRGGARQLEMPVREVAGLRVDQRQDPDQLRARGDRDAQRGADRLRGQRQPALVVQCVGDAGPPRDAAPPSPPGRRS